PSAGGAAEPEPHGHQRENQGGAQGAGDALEDGGDEVGVDHGAAGAVDDLAVGEAGLAEGGGPLEEVLEIGVAAAGGGLDVEEAADGAVALGEEAADGVGELVGAKGTAVLGREVGEELLPVGVAHGVPVAGADEAAALRSFPLRRRVACRGSART